MDSQSIGDIQPVYKIKLPCPRDLGVFICQECQDKDLVDFQIGLQVGCGMIVDDKCCGYSHLGLEWCDDCIKGNRRTHSHMGEYEMVGTIRGEIE